MNRNQLRYKIWPSMPDDWDTSKGRQIKNPVVLRRLALQRAKDTACPCFRCPCCQQLLPLDYGRMSRLQWPHEYEFHCIDCIKGLDLEKEAKRR